MDWNNLFSGFAGSVLTTIVAILVPIIAHRYTINSISKISNSESISPLASMFVSIFTAAEIPYVKRFKVEWADTYTHPHMDFSVTYDSERKSEKMFSGRDAFFSIIFPGSTEPYIVKNPKVGWTKFFEVEKISYRLTYVSNLQTGVSFELRDLDNIGKH